MATSLRGVDVLTYDSSREASAKTTAISLLAICAVVAALNPGAALGALIALPIVRSPQPRSLRLWGISLALAGLLITLHSFVLVAWPWRIAFGPHLVATFPFLTPLQLDWNIAISVVMEALAGP